MSNVDPLDVCGVYERGVVAKKQIKRNKCKRAVVKRARAKSAEQTPKYLRDPKAAPVLVTAYWARRDIRDEKLRLDPALSLLAPRLETMIATAKGAEFERVINQVAKLYDMEVRRRKADQEYVIETMKCQVNKDLTEAQLAANNPPEAADSHPADFTGADDDELSEDHPPVP